MIRRSTPMILALLGLLTFTQNAGATDTLRAGSPDPSFGQSGVATTQVRGWSGLNWGLVQADGKPVGVGQVETADGHKHLAAVRYNANGSLDTGFGTNGVVEVPVGNQSLGAAVVQQPDGKLLVAGNAIMPGGYRAAVVRLNRDGSLDSSYGSGGIFTATAADGVMPWAAAQQSDGSLVLAGTAVSGANRLAALRVTPSGQLDRSFGADGFAIFDGVAAAGWGLALTPDEKPVIAGEGVLGSGEKVAVTLRLTHSGQPDTNFGTGGLVITQIGIATAGLGVVANPDGSVVVAAPGYTTKLVNAAFKLTPSGALDSSFGVRGISTWQPVGENTVVRAPDGKLVFAGVGMSAVRLNAEGSLDKDFGQNGIVQLTVGEHGAANGVAIAPDGKLVLTGVASVGGQAQIATVRLMGDPVVAPSAPPPPATTTPPPATAIPPPPTTPPPPTATPPPPTTKPPAVTAAPSTPASDRKAPSTSARSLGAGRLAGTINVAFSSSESGVRYQCRIDGDAFQPCSSPYTTPRLSQGRHRLSVRATDRAGNLDASPANVSFTVSASAKSRRGRRG